jgi:hypothetical protein
MELLEANVASTAADGPINFMLALVHSLLGVSFVDVRGVHALSTGVRGPRVENTCVTRTVCTTLFSAASLVSDQCITKYEDWKNDQEENEAKCALSARNP